MTVVYQLRAVELMLLVVSLDRLQELLTRIEWIWREKLLGEEEGVETMQVFRIPN
jgi:hypothetical protein